MKGFEIQPEGYDFCVFNMNGQNFLYSAHTLTYFPLTECAKDIVLCDPYLSLGTIPASVENKYQKEELDATVKKLEEFKDNDIFAKISGHDIGDMHFWTFYLKLICSKRCNLNCSYCFSSKDKESDMTFAVAKRAIDFFVNEFVKERKAKYVIDLTGAGEPLLHLDFIKKVSDYVLEIKKQKHINIFCQLASNGMLLTPKVADFLRKQMILFGVSLDGTKKKSEETRRGLDYNKVVSNLKSIKNHSYLGLAATYSGNNFDFIQIFKSLQSLEPEVIGMKPVRLFDSSTSAITMDNIEAIENSYCKFAKWIYNKVVSGRNKEFDILMGGEDYFARFLRIVISPIRLFYRCSAGLSSISVNNKGEILICPAFADIEGFSLGNIYSGLDKNMIKELEQSYADEIPECKDCWARYICGGECFAVSYIQNKSLNKPVSVMCRLKKHLAKLSIYFWLCMKYEYPDVYVKMQKKYGGLK